MKATKSNFSERLRNYSRVISAKLELNRTNATKVLGVTAAASAALSASNAADAAIVHSGPVNLNTTAFYGYGGGVQTFDVNGLANFGISAAWFPYLYYGFRQVGFGTTGAANSTGAPGPNGEQIVFAPGANGNNQPDMLAAGDNIDSNSPWFAPAINPANNNKALVQATGFSPYLPGNNWPNPGYSAATTGYAGIRFNSTGGSDQHYGWVRLQLGSDGFGRVTSVTVLDWAYNDVPGQAIAAGSTAAIPEPTSGALATLGALALGASSVRSVRKRKEAQAA